MSLPHNMAYKKLSIFILSACIFLLFIRSNALGLHQGLNEFYYKRNSCKRIAITFDDGPHPRYTRRILNILSKYNVEIKES